MKILDNSGFNTHPVPHDSLCHWVLDFVFDKGDVSSYLISLFEMYMCILLQIKLTCAH